MNNMRKQKIFIALMTATAVGLQLVYFDKLRAQDKPAWPTDTMAASELLSQGRDNGFMDFHLISGGNAPLHGYVPTEGDTVEWYTRNVNCSEPDKQCDFELAIRKKSN